MNVILFPILALVGTRIFLLIAESIEPGPWNYVLFFSCVAYLLVLSWRLIIRPLIKELKKPTQEKPQPKKVYYTVREVEPAEEVSATKETGITQGADATQEVSTTQEVSATQKVAASSKVKSPAQLAMEERLAELYARWLSDPTLRYRGSGASLDSGFDDDLDSWVKGSDSWKKDLDSWAKGSDSWDEDLDDSLDDDTDDDWDNSWKAGGLPRDLSPYSDIDDPYDRADLEYEDDLDDLDDY